MRDINDPNLSLILLMVDYHTSYVDHHTSYGDKKDHGRRIMGVRINMSISLNHDF